MADFFNEQELTDALYEGQPQTEEHVEQPTAPQEPQRIKLGEDEYDPQELSQLVGLGKIAREAETKYNTKIDRVWPEFTRSQNELKQYREQMEQIQQQPATPQDEQIRLAREAAKNIGIVTEDQFEDHMARTFRKFYVTERAAERLNEEADDLESELNGSDGRPAFKKDVIYQHMLDTGIKNLEKAYKDKYESELETWKEQKLLSKKTPGMVTQSGGNVGNKMPAMVRPTKDNLNDLINEALRGE